ncbi:Holliday junction DNA helicase RuvA [Anaerohalosphaera lusitana]|uniref:Holliday junction branch migration complex subunit RuvA n=1 Tax=Anaerohalosphaera lusitana TaxID=1936003 RepID=A0A1U9NI84_9BACT|nr:Holliday junction branch migration protein RuvA [Anaerohalosphaera lusitana]AQT67631.1 Holliday junction DNA helicase RuvA [Anaerohalosphaera lusitana]
MIAQIEGKLTSLTPESGLLKVGPISYEIMLPGYAVSQLAGQINSDVSFYTMQYLEGSPGGGNLLPRLVGFLSEAEREFFHQYTSVKGMGIRKGLKSLTLPVATIAGAIESGDEKLLKTLPQVGKRLAQLMIAQLQGKLEGYAVGETTAAGGGGGASFANYQVEALEILVAWGEKRAEAMELIELASNKHPDVKSAEELVPLVYKIKQGTEV